MTAPNIGNGRTPKTGPKQIAREQRAARILNGRVAGKRLVVIAAEEGISTSRVAQIVEAELDARKALALASLRRLEAERLDALQAAAWPAASRGSVRAIEVVLGIMARRARLLGLDAPARMVVDDGAAYQAAAAKASLEAKLAKLSEQVPAGPVIEDVTYMVGMPTPSLPTPADIEDLPEPEAVDDILMEGEDPYGEAHLFER